MVHEMRRYSVHHFRILRASILALVLLAAGCATSGGSGVAGASADTKESQESSPVMTADEIQQADLPNAWELVSRLRRPWLRQDKITGKAVRVYMEQRDIGGAEVLRNIPASEVAELRFFDSEAAINRWGQSVESSVIEVIRS